jgi:hypothetical protein
MRRGLRIALPIVLLVAVVGGDTAAWLAATGYLERGFDGWATRQREAGWRVSSGPLRRGGWPIAATVTVPDLAVAEGADGVPGHVAWHANAAVLGLTVQNPTLLTADIQGSQTLRIEPGPEVSFTADRIHIEVPLARASGAPIASLEVRNLRGAGTTIGLLTGQATDGPTPTLTMSTEAIELPSDRQWPLGPHISSLAIDATLRGGLPPPGSLAASAAAWRDAGGGVDITHLALGWGPLGLAATAQLGLDSALQPTGTADLHVVGYAKTMAALAERRVITENAALAATAVMTLMAHVPADGGAPEVEVPLTLRNGKLLMGQTPLVRVPKVEWAAP